MTKPKKTLKYLKCDICDSPLVRGKIVYQNYEKVVAYLHWPKDLALNWNDLIRICQRCAKKHSLKSILGNEN